MISAIRTIHNPRKKPFSRFQDVATWEPGEPGLPVLSPVAEEQETGQEIATRERFVLEQEKESSRNIVTFRIVKKVF